MTPLQSIASNCSNPLPEQTALTASVSFHAPSVPMVRLTPGKLLLQHLASGKDAPSEGTSHALL